jgi:iron complex outermembrane recepter protein
MFRKTKVCSSLMLAFGGSLAVGTAPASAQQQQLERVEVTGTRILTLDAESASPLQVITAADIAASGAVTLQDLLQKNPTMGQPTFGRTNSNFDNLNSGVATTALRNLGEARTLVLVNGRRFVSGIPGDSAVDLNAIPTDFIERIELLTGGASAVYGSDAVAGVVNIILKRDFQGLTVDVSAGQSEKNDDRKKKVSLTWGANIADGKGNVMVHLGYTKQGAVLSKDRSGLETDNISLAALTGSVQDLLTFQTPFYSSFAPQGRIFLRPNPPVTTPPTPNPSVTFDANGNIIPFSTNGPAGNGVGATGFNRQDFRTIAIPTERYLFAAKGDLEFAPKHRAFMEGTYSSTSTQSRLEPFPMASSGINSIYPGTNQVPADFLVNGVLVKNPMVPAGIYNLLTPDPVTGVRYYDFTRRLNEVGARGNNAELDTFRAVSGVKGNIVDNWDYEVFGSYGQTKRSQVSGGQVNVLNFRNALEAIPDANGNPICRDADAVAQGCVPISIFGFNSITPAALKYIIAPTILSTSVTQKLLGGSITGEPFSLPAGPVGVAAGAEYRKEFSRSELDPLAQAGLNAGNAIPATIGQFDVKEFFVETRVPLLKDAPFAKSLSVSAAVSNGNYSTVGSTLSWNAGAEWAVNSEFKVRATRTLSTRAPNIGELYSPPLQNFPAVSDPCVGVTATSVGARDSACRSDPGVAANIAANGSFTLNQADLQGTSGFDRGNPNLDEEKGRSTTIGVVYAPKSIPVLDKFSFTADYFRIGIAKAIVETPRQFLLNQCYGGDASFCSFIQRNATAIGANSAGFLQRVDTAQTNSGGLFTSGVDVTTSYSDLVGPGRLNGRLSWTHLISGYNVPLPGAPRDHFAGEIGAATNRASLALGYSMGPWGLNTQFTYIGESDVDDQILATLCADDPNVCAVPGAPGSVKFPAKTYMDMQLTYAWGKVQYYFGIENVFNTKAPRIDTNNPFGIGSYNGSFSTGTGTVGDVYDPIGRRFNAGLRVSF